jgi:hypothetical protein
MSLRNVGIQPEDYTVQQPRRPTSYNVSNTSVHNNYIYNLQTTPISRTKSNFPCDIR